MNAFLLGALGSLVVTMVWAVIAWFGRKKIRNLISKLLYDISNVGALSIYKNRKDDDNYRKDLSKEINKAKKIKIYSVRGAWLMDEPFMSVLGKGNVDIEILLYNTENMEWDRLHADAMLKHREANYNETTRKDLFDAYVAEIRSNYKGNGIKIRRYHTVCVGIAVITENIAFFIPYQKDVHGYNTPVYKYSKKSSMYNWVAFLFEQIWKRSEETEIVT